jgi:hypothetical protein
MSQRRVSPGNRGSLEKADERSNGAFRPSRYPASGRHCERKRSNLGLNLVRQNQIATSSAAHSAWPPRNDEMEGVAPSSEARS